MKPLRGFIFVLVALVVAFSAACLASMYFKKPVPDTAVIVVAGARILPGDRLVADNLKKVRWPLQDVPPGSFYQIKEVEGRVVASSINKSEPVNEKRLVPRQGMKVRDFSGGIKPGMRAVSIKIGSASEISGILKKGDLVDVIAASTLDKQKKERISRVILSRVTVLGVDYKKSKRDGPKALKPETVTLVLSQKDALTLSVSEGAVLKLIKRNPFDEAVDDHEDVLFTSSLGPKTTSDIQRMIAKRNKHLQKTILIGMRAITIRVNDEDGICGFLRPGNRVDVLATHGFITAEIHGKHEPGAEGTVIDSGMASKILMQNVEVLFVEEDVSITGGRTDSENGSVSSKGADGADSSNKKSVVDWISPWPTKRVSLLVSPRDAERLAVITATSANVKLISRKHADSKIVETTGEKSNDIFYREKELYHDITIFGRRTGRDKKRFNKKTLEEDEIRLSPHRLEEDIEL